MEEEGLEEGQEVVGCKSAGSRWGCAPGRWWGRWKWVDSRSILQVESLPDFLRAGCGGVRETDRQAQLRQLGVAGWAGY